MTPAQRAAERLSAQAVAEGRIVTHRVHSNEQGEPILGRSPDPHKRVKVTSVGSGGQNRRAVVVRGFTYASRKEACKLQHICNATLRKWLRTGQAHFVRPRKDKYAKR